MKTLTKFALTGALIFGLNSCAGTKEFIGIVNEVKCPVQYKLTNLTDTLYVNVEEKFVKDLLHKGDIVKVKYFKDHEKGQVEVWELNKEGGQLRVTSKYETSSNKMVNYKILGK